MKDLKSETLKRLSFLRDRTTKGHVHPALMGEFMLILVSIRNDFNLDLMELGTRAASSRIQPPGFRQANDPRPITADDYEKFPIDGDVFRTSLGEAIQRLGGYAPPKAPIGFVR